MNLFYEFNDVHKLKTRRLATANRSRVSIRGRPRKNFITSTVITRQHSVVVSDTVCAHVGGPKNMGMFRPDPLR